jgi:hypothetical protein
MNELEAERAALLDRLILAEAECDVVEVLRVRQALRDLEEFRRILVAQWVTS